MTGRYTCEVSTEKIFETATKEANMTVIGNDDKLFLHLYWNESSMSYKYMILCRASARRAPYSRVWPESKDWWYAKPKLHLPQVKTSGWPEVYHQWETGRKKTQIFRTTKVSDCQRGKGAGAADRVGPFVLEIQSPAKPRQVNQTIKSDVSGNGLSIALFKGQ